MKEITVYAPASIGNIGPGFDVLGVAISNIGDWVTATKKRGPGVEILSIEGDGGKLPLDPTMNTASIAAANVLARIGAKEGLNLKIKKGVPFPSGLGSSAASAVAGAVVAARAFGDPLSMEDILRLSTEAEAAVSGGFFCDNTAAALYGGGIVSRIDGDEIHIIKLGSIPAAVIVIAQPDFPMPTKKARKVLPKKVDLHDFVWNMGAAASITAAFLKKDATLFGRSVDDRVVEPARAKLIPGFADVKSAALNAGALGCSISGAGATIFAVTDSKSAPEKIGQSMKKAFKKNGLAAKIHICSIDARGARAVS